ncbi:hypothetical protein A1Q1_04023 [Trichosporon asahii var. asahii CBS 2479]|uniref:Peptidase C14 caspase domain-containing protein n=1 Tax=Trichosporon asahii var. asahii (strain ATCC 90039 / CBS 2479 / JCM 2466 / KCTC 7840 / NBRC 103889/ NCYC 2677 / UAMH 7654) TaxID=1186058 RepID=J4U979_TRIAS|nr:hypothetical protein A1Q1_04023 [Trichosporon asahii var. asahii CBS 2479]EJT47165.1 hypothetical protein A1Q1_04023 [Trichosporon asahii var. asahii CBS 2479]
MAYNQYQNNPPPPQWANYGGYQQGGYQQGGFQQGGYQQGGYQQAPPPQNYQQQHYPPPTGAPPPSHYQPTAAGYQPPSGPPQQHYQPPQGAPPRTGKRKALLIGINYRGQSGELRGCINDVHNVQKFLIERHGYKPDDMVVLTDDSRNPRQIPTRANMIAAMQWLVQGARANDALFFHYSGHGGQTKDKDGDEDDGYDEVIYPVDFKQAGHIVDDESTCLDLPYVYSTEGKIKEPNLLAEAGQGVLGAGMSYLRGDIGGVVSGLMSVGKNLMGSNSKAGEVTKQTRTSPADVVMWSGCKDSQTSADTTEAGTGAMSYAFIAALTKNPRQSYVMLLRSIRDELAGRYDQKPQLSASHPIDTNLMFIC